MLHKSCLTGRLGAVGFTLIELLVVVLIIGILAAIALPQYQKVIEKSKAVQAITLLRAIGHAGQAYRLATGQWPTSLDVLAVDLPNLNSDWILSTTPAANKPFIWLKRSSGPYQGAGFQWTWDIQGRTETEVPRNQILCMEWQDGGFSGAAGRYCEKLFKGQQTPHSGSRVYKLP